MNKVCAFLLTILLIPTMCFAHSGRLDGSGGHRVNKFYIFDGRYVVVKDSIKYYQSGKLFFHSGDYHYHVHPSANGFLDGIYLAAKDKDVKNTITSNVFISKENVVASKNSNLYHNPDSRYVARIKEENIVIFEDFKEAESNGYKPAESFEEYVPGVSE